MNICSICLDDIDNEDIYYLKCNHSYHIYCINEWFDSLAKKYTCPECRKTHCHIDINYSIITSPRAIYYRNNIYNIENYNYNRDDLKLYCFYIFIISIILFPMLICLMLILKKM